MRALFLFAILMAASNGRAELFPEDGSLKAGTWWVSTAGELPPLEKLQAVLSLHGVAVKKSRFSYSYLQDVLFFDEAGRVMVQADMSKVRDRAMTTLTLGVYEDGEGTLTRYKEADASADGFSEIKSLKGTLLEGGAIISGRFASGTPYVLTDRGTLERTAAYLKISREESLAITAADLGVSPENFIELSPWSGHLDLSIQAFPGGVLLLHDPSMKAAFLREALLDPAITSEEKRELQETLRAAEAEKDDSHLQKIFDQNTERLRLKGFKVIRVPGRFSQFLPGFPYPLDKINFLNGTVGRGANGELFILTNRSPGLPSLQRLWARTLARQLPIEEMNIHFTGRYGYGAGVDCTGVLAPL